MSRARILADYVSSGDELADKAPIASPTFTGTVAIPNVANLETAVVANTAKVTNYNQTLADINALDVTELGTVTSGNLSNTAIVYPAGHVIQTFTSGTSPMGNTYTGTASTDIQLAPTGITSGNKLLLIFSGELSTNQNANTTNHVNNIYLEGTAAESGLGSTTSGPNFVNEYGRYSNDWAFINYNITILTAAVTTATPTYRIYHNYTNPDSAITLYYTNWYASAFEIQQ